MLSFTGNKATHASYAICISFDSMNIILQLFGGAIVSLESLGDWVSWLRYLSFAKYGVEVSNSVRETGSDLMLSLQALSINELDGLIFSCFER